MSKGAVAALWIIVILIGLGLIFVLRGSGGPLAGTATTTVTTTQNQTAQTSAGLTRQADMPKVETGTSVSVSASTASVTGKVTPNGALTTYWYDYDTTTALNRHTSQQSIGSGFTAISAPALITGLAANTTYYYRLTARNRLGTVNGATLTFTTNDNPPAPGASPTVSSLPASSITRTSANLNGRVNPEGSDTTYWFEFGTDTNLGSITVFQSAGSGNSIQNVSIALSNLNPLTKYYYRLNAQNQFGTKNGAIETFTTLGPRSPGTPSLNTTTTTNIASTTATFNGRLSPNGADTTYWFEYTTNSLLGSIIGTMTPTQTISAGVDTVNVSFDTSGLSKGTTYYVQLVGQNQFGTIRGNVVTFTTRGQ